MINDNFVKSYACANLGVMKKSADIKVSWKSGFTIIEVLIVLAIAGIILLIVFMAVPNLERNYRNHRREEAVGYVFSELESYYDQHGHYPDSNLPTADTDRDAFITTLDSGPSTGYTIRYADLHIGAHEWPYSGGDAPATLSDALDTVSVMHGHMCQRDPAIGPGDTDYPVEESTLGETNYHGFAVWTLLEGGSTMPVFCEDNVTH